MSDSFVRDSLLAMITVHLQEKGDVWRTKSQTALLEIFGQWKAEHGSRTPKTYRGSKGLGGLRPIEFDQANPYECVDNFECAHDFVSFCLFLLQSDYAPIIELAEEEYISDLLCVTALIEPEMTRLDSILTLIKLVLGTTNRDRRRLSKNNDMLRKRIADLGPAVKRDAKAMENLAVARPKGAEANKQAAIERKADLRKAAIDFFIKKPFSSVDECVSFLLARGIGTKRTIKDGIRGCKGIALQQIKDRYGKQG